MSLGSLVVAFFNLIAHFTCTWRAHHGTILITSAFSGFKGFYRSGLNISAISCDTALQSFITRNFNQELSPPSVGLIIMDQYRQHDIHLVLRNIIPT